MRALAETLEGVKRTLDTTRTTATRHQGLVDHGPRVRAILHSRVRRGPASGQQVATRPITSDQLTYHDHDLLANQDHKMSGQDVDQWEKWIMKEVDLDEMWIMKNRSREVDHSRVRSTREQDPQGHDPQPRAPACLVYIMGAAPGGRVLISRIGTGVKILKIFYTCMCVMIMNVWLPALPRNLITPELARMPIRHNPMTQALSS